MEKIKSLVFIGLSFILLASCEATKFDVAPKDIFIDGNNRMVIVFGNEGNAELPANKGNITMLIDGKRVGTYAFKNLSDQSYREVGSSDTIETNFRLAGNFRRLGIAVDTRDKINETNERQNTFTRTLNPPAIAGPDFVVSDLDTDDSDKLRIVVKNIGNATSSSNFEVKVRIIVNGTVATDLTPILPSLAPNEDFTIVPAVPISLTGNSEVRVLLNTYHFFDEIDDTNNVREERLPSGPSYSAYSLLMGDPKIETNIVWEDASGTRNYGEWTSGMQNDLRNAIMRLESGLDQPTTSPPAVRLERYIARNDAWQLFIEHIAQSLWVEKNNLVPWSILDMSDAELDYLLDSRKLLAYNDGNNSYFFSHGLMGANTSWNPQINYWFLKGFDMIKSDQKYTVFALTEWMRAHLIHISYGQTYLDLYGYAGLPPTDKILYPLEGKRHITAGCWGTSGLYASILRSVNIPVVHARTGFGPSSARHSRPFFPTIDLSMPHADDPYNRILNPSGNVIPVSEIFYTSAEMNTKFLRPTVDCDGSDCNSVGEQASYNRIKEHLSNARLYRADYLLYYFARNGEGYVLDMLRGPRRGGTVEEYAVPYFNLSERTTIVSEIKDYLRELGEGNIELGKSIVIERSNKFNRNK